MSCKLIFSHFLFQVSSRLTLYRSYSGIATHYLHSTSLPDLEARLGELQFKDYDKLDQRLRIINSTVEEFCTGLPHDQPIAAPVSGNIRAAIDYVFQPANDIDGIVDALDGLANMQEGTKGYHEVKEWAEKTKKTILQRSPTSVRVTLKQLRDGKSWGIAKTFRMEHMIASHFMEHPDFVEGVSSLLIRKPKTTPQWQPPRVDQVKDQDVNAFFEGTPELELLNSGEETNYGDYPHAWIGLPREAEVADLVRKRGKDGKQKIAEAFVNRTNGKQGVKEKVEEILNRKTEVRDGGLYWKR